MIKLKNMFSDGALFQANSVLEIKGVALNDKAERSVDIVLSGKVFVGASTTADSCGRFSVKIKTPCASFDEYDLTVKCGGEEKTVKNILFGELWLASGQSNMEMRNFDQTDKQKLFDLVRDKKIRMYHAVYHHRNNAGDFPWEPDEYAPGYWVDSGDDKNLEENSAVGLRFANDIYDHLNDGNDVPVGILDASWGGTSMRSWLPKDAVEGDEKILNILKKLSHFPSIDDWNKKGEGNYQQLSAQYNIKIAPLEGAKVRGIIWYQGETDIGGEFANRVYADYLRFYHKVYAKRFAADEENFFMISSLIYPAWKYGDSGECGVGYVNRAFVETAKEAPDKFIAVPNYDLKSSWAYHLDNHPIHPTHKYPLADRMADLALKNVYGKAAKEKHPAYMESYEVCGNKIKIKFAEASGGLEIKGENARALYAAGEDGIYLPASARADGAVLEIWCDEINDIKHAAYSVQSMEPFGNIWAGEYPIQPFFTDEENEIFIQSRPWYDMEKTSFWASKAHIEGHEKDVFYRPIWLADKESSVCRDDAFTLEGYSLRVEGENERFGCYVRSYLYNELDLMNFDKLSVNIYALDPMKAALRLKTDDGDIVIPLEEKEKLIGGWRTFEAGLSGIKKDASISEMHFEFEQQGGAFRFVNIEKVRLYK